jgi:hypothetical protein
MPYIKPDDRLKFDEESDSIALNATCAGDLNYAITRILHTYIKQKGLRYDTLNSVHGMLDACNKELYRKITGPYEETAIKRNGDLTIISQEDLQGKKY